MIPLRIMIIDDKQGNADDQMEWLRGRFELANLGLCIEKHVIVLDTKAVLRDDLLVKLVDGKLFPANERVEKYAEYLIDNYDVVVCDASLLPEDDADSAEDVAGLLFATYLKKLAQDSKRNIYCAVFSGQAEDSITIKVVEIQGTTDAVVDFAFTKLNEERKESFFKDLLNLFYRERLEFFRRHASKELVSALRQIVLVEEDIQLKEDIQKCGRIKIKSPDFNCELNELFRDFFVRIIEAWIHEKRKTYVQSLVRELISIDMSKELSAYMNLYGVKAATHNVHGRYPDEYGRPLSISNRNIPASIERQNERIENALNCCPSEFREMLRNVFARMRDDESSIPGGAWGDILAYFRSQIGNWAEEEITEPCQNLQTQYRKPLFQRNVRGTLFSKVKSLLKDFELKCSDITVEYSESKIEKCIYKNEECAIFFPFEYVFRAELEALWLGIHQHAYGGSAGKIEFYTLCCDFVENDEPPAIDFKVLVVFRNDGNSFPLDRISSCAYIQNLKENRFLEYWGDLLISIPYQGGTKTVSVLAPDVEVADPAILETIPVLTEGTQYTFVFNSCLPHSK